MKPHASLKLGSCVICLYIYLCIHHEHHEASFASTNHFKGLDLHLCSCFVGNGFTSQENHSSQPCKNSSSTQGASFKDSWEFSIHREAWSSFQLSHHQHWARHGESYLPVLWPPTPLLHISWLPACAYFGGIFSTPEDSYRKEIQSLKMLLKPYTCNHLIS